MFRKLLFGGDSAREEAPSVPDASRTINTIRRLEEHERSLEKRKELLEERVKEQLLKARDASRAGSKALALQCMKKKKLLEMELQNLDTMVMRVVEQRLMLEGQSTTVQVVSGLHKASKRQKEMLKDIGIKNVDKVMEAVNETRDKMQQVHESMGQSSVDLDEEELLGELADLEAAELDEELLAPAPRASTSRAQQQAGRVVALPSAPAASATARRKTKEQLELDLLEAEMAA